MRLLRLLYAVGVMAVAATCGAPLPEFFLRANPATITDEGQSTEVSVRVQDSNHKGIGGRVTVSTSAGDLEGQGLEASTSLDATGAGSLTFSCDRSADPGCHGGVRLEGRWELGETFLVEVTRVQVTLPDGGVLDGGP
jgi:hypothetical protein